MDDITERVDSLQQYLLDHRKKIVLETYQKYALPSTDPVGDEMLAKSIDPEGTYELKLHSSTVEMDSSVCIDSCTIFKIEPCRWTMKRFFWIKIIADEDLKIYYVQLRYDTTPEFIMNLLEGIAAKECRRFTATKRARK